MDLTFETRQFQISGLELIDAVQIAGEIAKRVERVLDVRQGQLCWVVGTVYMDMPLKPNILEDISKDVRAPEAHKSTHYADLYDHDST